MVVKLVVSAQELLEILSVMSSAVPVPQCEAAAAQAENKLVHRAHLLTWTQAATAMQDCNRCAPALKSVTLQLS